MKISETFYTDERRLWREWLAGNFETKREIWFVFPTKDSGEPGVSYNDAVEEALCFGWIDSTVGRLDATHGVRRFTPRRKGSPYSRPNIERLIWLDTRGLLHPKVRADVLNIIRTPFEFPADILEAIRSNPKVLKNYRQFPESYKRIRIAYIDAARHRPREFQKRLQSFLEKTRAGKMIAGYGGIDKYYGK